MKQLFALFCAIVLMPSFSAHAWIGGPFSNNTYFGENGDDGVYEAVAIPQVTGANGIGIFRWAVTNNFAGAAPNAIQTYTFTGIAGGSTDFATPVSGNINFGGISFFNHSWFIEGVSYFGICNGSVNSGIGLVSAIGVASVVAGLTNTSDSISSGFQATIANTGRGVPVRRFEGVGTAQSTVATLGTFPIFVFGSKVTDEINIATL